MKKIPQALDDRLLDYLDGNLNPAERLRLEDELKLDEALRARLEDLRALDTTLLKAAWEHPSRNFTALVMSRLDESPSRSSWSIRHAIFLFVGMMAVIGLALLLVSTGVFDDTATVNLNQVNIPKEFKQQELPVFTLNGKWIVNIIIGMTMVLGWILLDKAILKPYFQRRMHT